MHLRFTAAQEEFRAGLLSWLEKNLHRTWTEELLDPANGPDQLFDIRRRWQARLGAAGYLGVDWPVEWGGRGLTAVEKAIFAAETVHAPPSAARPGIDFLAPALIRHGTEEQRRRFLPKMLSAEVIWSQGFSEPDAGSDLAALRTRAEPDGDHFRIFGQKVWTTHGVRADWIFVLARTGTADRHGGITLFLLPLAQPEIEVRGIRQITDESEFAEVFFNGALARREDIVGAVGEGWSIAMTVLEFERGSMSLAHPARCTYYLRNLVKALREHGCMEDPDVRERIARLLVEVEVMRSNGLRTLAALSAGERPGPQSSFEKIYWSEYAQRIAETAVDLLGLQAQLLIRSPHARPEVNWSYETIRSRAYTIAGGTSEIQRNILSQRLLKLPRA